MASRFYSRTALLSYTLAAVVAWPIEKGLDAIWGRFNPGTSYLVRLFDYGNPITNRGYHLGGGGDLGAYKLGSSGYHETRNYGGAGYAAAGSIYDTFTPLK